MSSDNRDDSEKTWPRAAPNPQRIEFWSGVLPGQAAPRVPKPMSPVPQLGRGQGVVPRPTGSTRGPPPIPQQALRNSYAARSGRPPIPGNRGRGLPEEPADQRMRMEYSSAAVLQYFRELYLKGANSPELEKGKRAVLIRLKQAWGGLAAGFDSATRRFPHVPTRWIAAAATAIALASGGIAIHSCQENKRLEQRIEQLEKNAGTKKNEEKSEPWQDKNQVTKPTSSYIPKALRNPPQVPARIPQRLARNSLRS